MMKMRMISFFCVIQLLLTGNVIGQKQTLSKKQLKEDFIFLLDRLIEVHPDPFAAHSDLDLINEKNRIYEALDQEGLSKLDFWKITAPFITKLQDGHTELQMPRDSAFLSKSFPGSFSISKGDVFLTHLSDTSLTINTPVKVLSINGKKTEVLLKKYREYVSGELIPFKDVLLSGRLPHYLSLLDSPKDFYTVKLVSANDSKSVKEIQVEPGISLNQEKKKPSIPKFSASIDDQLAILTINSFSGGFKNFKNWLKKTFKKIALAQPRHIVLDLRKNGGGDSRFGDELFHYLHRGPFQQVDSLTVKSSKVAKKYFKQNFFGWSYYPLYPIFFTNPVLKASFASKNGKVYHHSFKSKKAKEKSRLDIETFLLISPRTYSSAHIFSNAFKHHSLGTVIGEPSGGIDSFFGDIVQVTLPNTRLKCDISFKEFHLPPTKKLHGGVQPDITIIDNPFNGLDEALHYIKSNQ